MEKKKNNSIQERRKYLRLDSVFPVQFRLMTLDGKCVLSNWVQGFTNNIGKGGICLSVNNLSLDAANLLKEGKAKLSLEICVPLSACPVNAEAKLSWIRPEETPGKYLIGLEYENILPQQNSRIYHVALFKRFFVPVALSIVILFCSLYLIESFVNYQLVKRNKNLVEKLVLVDNNIVSVKTEIDKIFKEREDLLLAVRNLSRQLEEVAKEKTELAQKAADKEKDLVKRSEEIEGLVSRLNKNKQEMEQKISVLDIQESSMTEKLLALSQAKQGLQKKNIKKMYDWLKVHQNARTGLVISFEGDSSLNNWAFIYDQALVVTAFTKKQDLKEARKILSFFKSKAQKAEGLFFNAYYSNDGKPAELIVHSGPNIWLGIAVLQYTYNTKDNSYLKIAEDIATAIIKLQKEDKDGGIRGGPEVLWYSTEHNLDAYAFFNMLYKVTGLEKYKDARDKTFKWIINNTYSKEDVPIKRGKGDSTIATDTYAWSIAAIGPAKLQEVGMDPDEIVNFAEKNCLVNVEFKRPQGDIVKIKGFDFAPLRHVARGGVVSSEWTAQMIISFMILSDYHLNMQDKLKAEKFSKKAQEYLLSLSLMIISSSSPSGQGEGCLPYSTAEYIDTGHGWFTPKGSSTGSVAGTTYALFAFDKFNPLEL